MLAQDVLSGVSFFTDRECSLIYLRIILLFELADSDDEAFNVFDPRIQNYCKDTGFEIIPKRTVADVDSFYQKTNLDKDYPSGVFVFSHSGRNQLRKLMHHLRNACAHGGIELTKKDNTEYFKITAKDRKKKKGKEKVKLFGLVPRESFEELWNTLINTLKFKS